MRWENFDSRSGASGRRSCASCLRLETLHSSGSRWSISSAESTGLFDVGGAIGLAGMALMVVVFTLKNTMRLYREERIAQ